MKTETFLPNVVKIERDLYRFKVGVCFWDTVYKQAANRSDK